MANDNRCVCCGEIIPEGMIACPNCLVVSKKKEMKQEMKQDPVEKILDRVDRSFIRKGVIEQSQYVTTCLVCGEAIPVPFGHCYPRICGKCKAAVMKVRAEDGK
jgi:hypothetical protein